MAQAEALQRALTSIDVSDPHLYQQDSWRPLFAKLRRDDPVHYCASQFGPYWSLTRCDDIFTVARSVSAHRAAPHRRADRGRLYSNFTRGILLPVQIISLGA